MAIQQSISDLEKHLRRQFDFLRRSCEAYDRRFTDEAIRLAVVVRTLVHDTTQSKSLLYQLNVKDNMEFFDSSDDYDATTYIVDLRGLALMKLSTTGAEFVPRCTLSRRPDLVETWKPFGKWWQKVVIVDSRKQKFSRRDIVLNLANKDGGAHVSPELDASYAALTRENSMGWTFDVPGDNGPVTGIETASSRQIAHEMIVSLERLRSDLR